MYKSFKNFKEDRDILEFGSNYENLCLTILESGMTFDEFWIEHGLPMFLNIGDTDEKILMEGWMDATRGGVAALGTLGKQAIRGGANALAGMGQAGYGALQAGAGLGKGALGGSFDTFQNGMSNVGGGLARAGSGIGQAALAPVSAGIRGYEAGKQNGFGMNTGNQLQQWMGTRQAADPNQQAEAQPQPQPQALNPNQQKAAITAMGSIKTEFNKAMQNLQNSGDAATQNLAKQFVEKINQYMDKIQVRNGGGTQPLEQGQIAPTFGASTPPKNRSPAWRAGVIGTTTS